MVPFFVGYALVVWYVTCRWRRQVRGFAVLLAGITGLLLVSWGHYELGQWSMLRDPDGQGIYLPVLQSIMYPYTVLVTVVGLFLAVLPVRHPPEHCPMCGYDLAGVTHHAEVCPECGERLDGHPQPNPHRRSGVRRENLRVSDTSPAEDPVRHPAHQDQPGQPDDQHPPDHVAPATDVADHRDLPPR